jgi:PEGA domain
MLLGRVESKEHKAKTLSWLSAFSFLLAAFYFVLSAFCLILNLVPKVALLLLSVLLLSVGRAQEDQASIVIPTFGVRGEVDEQVLQDFMRVFREAVAERTGLDVRSGELISQGLAGSLESEVALFSAELEGTRFAVLGEVRAVAETYAVSMLVADATSERSSDVLDEAFAAATVSQVAVSLAVEVARFVTPVEGLQPGSASLFISSQPSGAEVFINDNKVGETGTLDVLGLQPGSYQIEVRGEGFLPETRHVDLKDGVTELLNVVLTPVAGGSLQVITSPNSEILIDDRSVGLSPMTVQALPGTRIVQLQRPGFESVSREVQVRENRVTRIEERLEPSFERMVFWDLVGPGLLTIDGVLQSSSYAEVSPGEHIFEVRQGGEQRTFTLSVPDKGVYKFNLETGRLEPHQGF